MTRLAAAIVVRALLRKVALAATILAGLVQPVSAQEAAPPPVETNLYAGRLLVVDGKNGATSGGSKLWTVRMTSTFRLKGGLQLGARGDITALEQIDPTSLDLSAARSLEGYAGLSRPWAIGAGLTAGPALVAGSLIPSGERGQATYGGGARFGLGRSWLYGLWGTNGAADTACSCAVKRKMLAGSIEFGRFVLAGDVVTGKGGYRRLAVLMRLPMIGGGQ